MKDRYIPNHGDIYYYPVTDMGVAEYGRNVYDINDLTGLLHARHRMCFKTRRAAILASRAMLKALHGDEMVCTRTGTFYECASCCNSFLLPEDVKIKFCPVCEAPVKKS